MVGLLDRIYEIARLLLQEFLILNMNNFFLFSFCCCHLAAGCSLSAVGELQHRAIRFQPFSNCASIIYVLL